MRKKMTTGITAAALSLMMSMSAFAGQWVLDGNGWWWQNDQGSYPAGTWEWIDSNGDGIAESYYFNDQGYCLQNTTTPDGYTVDGNGAWTVNGIVQTMPVSAASTPATTAGTTQYADDYSGTYTVPFYEADGTVTSQAIIITYDAASNTITANYPRLGLTQAYVYAGYDYAGNLFFELISEEEKDSITFSAPGILAWPSDNGVQNVPRS